MRRRETGQALAEFAIVAVPMLLLLLGILQFGLIYNAQVGLTNAIRDAARYGSGLPATDPGLAATAAASTYVRLRAALTDYVIPYDAANLVTGTGNTEVCYEQRDDGTGALHPDPAFVRVTAVYDHPILVPLIGALIAPSGAFRITVTTEIRVDNPDQTLVTVGSPAVCNI